MFLVFTFYCWPYVKKDLAKKRELLSLANHQESYAFMQVWEDYTSDILRKPANRQPVAFHYYKNVVRRPRILFMFAKIS